MSTTQVEIEVFSGPNCVHCEAAKKLLIENGIEFVERRIDNPDELAELQLRLPRAMALPQIFIDGEYIGNDDDLRIRMTLARSPFDTR